MFHSTWYTDGPGLPEIVTVHDMLQERLTELFPDGKKQVAVKRRGIERAKICIAISESTAKDLREVYPWAAGKIRVIHHGAEHLAGRAGDIGAAEAMRGRYGEYVLFVGERHGYKNFAVVLEAMTRTGAGGWPAASKLVLVGREFSPAENQALQEKGLAERVVHLGRVSDGMLATCYQGAGAFVFPSRMEGFGFPVLEAQGLGVPLICSDTAVFREIAGEGAVFFDPLSGDGLASAVGRVLGDAEGAKKLVEAGRRNVGRFSWDRCAELTRAIYAEVAGA